MHFIFRFDQTEFFFLAVDAQSPWIAAAGVVPFDIDAYILNESSSPFWDPKIQLQRLARLDQGEALLIRPDGFIAWRTTAHWTWSCSVRGA